MSTASIEVLNILAVDCRHTIRGQCQMLQPVVISKFYIASMGFSRLPNESIIYVRNIVETLTAFFFFFFTDGVYKE